MTDKKKNGWIKFVPSLDLPKERVSIAYDTHDERGVRYTYGHFQFYNGSCGCFWKDGNEQPKVVKAEYIKYWMPVPSLDAQEEPKECMYSKDNYTDEDRKVLCEGCEEECKFNKKEEPVSEDLEKAIDTYLATYFGGEKEKQEWPFLKKMAIHFANWQKQKDSIPVSEDLEEVIRKYEQRLEKENPATEAYDFASAIRFGANWKKQQMMKNAVDATVHIDAGGYPYIPQMELYDYDKDIPLAKEGDKYKVILIKED